MHWCRTLDFLKALVRNLMTNTIAAEKLNLRNRTALYTKNSARQGEAQSFLAKCFAIL